MSDQKPKSLVTKLAEVMAATERVPKNGWNDFHKYKFARESDIVESIRGELAARNILITPSILSHERTESTNSKGNKTFFTLISIDWSIRDGDSSEVICLRIPGTAEDTGDKGFYKAFTGSEKYLLTKTFLIPTGDDPENDDNKPQGSLQATAAPTGRHYQVKPDAQLPRIASGPVGKTVFDGPQDQEAEAGKAVGVVGKVNASPDGKCWFVSVGALGTAKGESVWTRDADLAEALKESIGQEVHASLRSRKPGSYQIVSFVPSGE
jgi:ERF superfamily